MTNDLKIRFLNRGVIEQKDRLRVELDSQVAEFLAAGGGVTEVPAGATAGYKEINSPINAIKHDDIKSILKTLPEWRLSKKKGSQVKGIHRYQNKWVARWKNENIGSYNEFAQAVVAQTKWLNERGITNAD